METYGGGVSITTWAKCCDIVVPWLEVDASTSRSATSDVIFGVVGNNELLLFLRDCIRIYLADSNDDRVVGIERCKVFSKNGGKMP